MPDNRIPRFGRWQRLNRRVSRNQSHFSEARQRRPPQIADGTNIFTRNLTLDRFVGPGVRNNSIKVLARSGVVRAFSQTTSRKPTTHVSSRGRGVFTLSSGHSCAIDRGGGRPVGLYATSHLRNPSLRSTRDRPSSPSETSTVGWKWWWLEVWWRQ